MSREKTISYKASDLQEYTPVPHLNLPDIEAKKAFKPKDGRRYKPDGDISRFFSI